MIFLSKFLNGLSIVLSMIENPLARREVIIELFPVGNLVRVTAMDVATLTEISIQGPKSAGEDTLKRNGLKRLEYVLRKKGYIA